MEGGLGIALADFSASVSIGAGVRSLSICVHSWSDQPSLRKTGLISYAFYNGDNQPLKPIDVYSDSTKFGPYFYLSRAADDGSAVTRANLAIPDGAVRCELNGHDWRPGVVNWLLEAPLIQELGSESDSLVLPQGVNQVMPLAVADFICVSSVKKNANTVRIESSFRTMSPGRLSKAFLLVELIGSGGETVLPSGELPINPTLGSYIELSCEAGEITGSKTVSIRIPDDCVQISFRGSPRSSRSIALTDLPSITYVDANDAQGDLGEFFTSIPPDANLLVMYSNSRAGGGCDMHDRSSRMAAEYAAAGNWVIVFRNDPPVVDMPKIPQERVHVIEHQHFHSFMEVAMRRHGNNNRFVCSSFPDLHIAASMDRMQDNSWIVVYEACEDLEERDKVEPSQWFNPFLEARVAKRSDRVFAVSPRLLDKIAAIGNRSDVVLVPNAAPAEVIHLSSYLRKPSSIELRMKSCKVGYIGSLAPSWFDWDLLVQVAGDLPWVDFEIIGYGYPSGIVLPKNIVYIGDIPYADCLPHVEHWRVGLVPFKISPLTLGMDPHQVYEYIAMGLRTVTSITGSVREGPGLWLYQGVENAVAAIAEAITTEITDSELVQYEEYVRNAKWSDRARQVLCSLETRQK